MDKNDQKSKNGKIRRIVIEGLIYIVLILTSVFVVPEYVVQRTVVEGESMEDTLMDADNLIVNKISLRVSEPKRFDIVVFHPFGLEEDYFVKRVIGLPGEEVWIEEGNIYINGEMLEEDFGKDDRQLEPGIANKPIRLGADEYFLMGDNRSESYDSRDEEIGPVKRNYIVGKVMLRIWPLDKFGFVP